MIRIQRDGVEIALTYEEFIREVREGRITADTPVQSDVLTMGAWRTAGELQFFRSWSPTSNNPPEPFGGYSAPSPDERAAGVPSEVPGERRTGGLPAWDPESATEVLPWEAIEQLGFFRAFTRTIRLAMTKADAFAHGIAAGDTVMPSLVFGLLVTAVASVFDAVYAVGALRLAGPLIEQMGSSLSGLLGPSGMPTARDILFQHGMGILFYPALVFVWGESFTCCCVCSESRSAASPRHSAWPTTRWPRRF